MPLMTGYKSEGMVVWFFKDLRKIRAPLMVCEVVRSMSWLSQVDGRRSDLYDLTSRSTRTTAREEPCRAAWTLPHFSLFNSTKQCCCIFIDQLGMLCSVKVQILDMFHNLWPYTLQDVDVAALQRKQVLSAVGDGVDPSTT